MSKIKVGRRCRLPNSCGNTAGGELKMADNGVLRRKAYNAQLIYEDLLDRLGMEGIPTTFVADEGRRAMLSLACFSSNPFPRCV